MTNKRRPSTLWLSPQEQADLAALAAVLGYFQTRGAGTGKLGSISAMLRGIQRGELLVVPRQRNGHDLVHTREVPERLPGT
jgi:hypothetical protein